MIAVLILLCVLAAPAILWGRLAHFRRTAEHTADRAEADRLTYAWRAACEGSGVARTVQTVTGPTVSTPQVVSMVLGPPTVLVVRLLPGQVLADLRKAGPRMAPHLGAVALRWERRGHEHARCELLTVDPLTDPIGIVDADPLAPVRIARTEEGTDIRLGWDDWTHWCVQGATGSGKSSWLYSILGAAADRARAAHDLVIAGVDPSGLLLRPFSRSEVHARWQVCGLSDLGRVDELLTWLVSEMDRRIEALPAEADAVVTGPDLPRVLCIFEEYPALLRAADTHDTKLGKRIRALVGRLLSESRKAGYSIVLVAQRAEATLVGGNERAQCESRLSFRCDGPESVKLLHPSVDPGLSDALIESPPGIGLLNLPGRPLSRVRAPWAGGYAAYVERVMR
ncbi:MAG: hypothetical protein EKK42_15570 [Pseudonocardiaceae bacterium]|nr:MAG: hypothetical protein EKK42_15570 [Pseudonocardiaceae bacterium]